MSNRYLGETIDIHAGGQDLKFPLHHENEIVKVKLEAEEFLKLLATQ